jgi:N4-gp56 family major capsid protein
MPDINTLRGNPGAAVQYSGANQAGTHTIKPDAYYDKLLLKMLRQMEFHYAKYAVEKTLPRNYGDTINWRRFNKLSTTKTPLIEGVTPPGQNISGSEVIAIIAQYGNVMYFTDIIDLQQLDRVRQEYTVELGYQAKETIDEIVRDTLVAEGSVYFPSGQTALSGVTKANGKVSIDDFRKIVLGMKRGFIGGNRKAGGKYVALVAPEIMFSLFDDEKVQNYMDYGRTVGMYTDGMIVDMFGIRFEEVLNSPMLELTAQGQAGNFVHDSIVIGEEAYAITKLEGQNIKVITKGLGSAGVEDPLDQRQSIGWKMTGFSTKVLLPEAIVNYWAVAIGADEEIIEAPNFTYDDNVGPLTITFALATGSGVTLGDTTAVIESNQTLADAIAALDPAPVGVNVTYWFDAAATQPATPSTLFFTEDRTIYVNGTAIPNGN